MNTLIVHNPNNLPVMSYTLFHDFQGDLKLPMEPESLRRMKKSLKKHGVFVPKFVWFHEETPFILDGHQTTQTLQSLENDGWAIPDIPYVVIEAETREDAAEKLLQINSQYARFNTETSWFSSFNFEDIGALMDSIQVPELSIDPEKVNSLEPLTLEKEQIRPIYKIHVLLSFPTDKYAEMLPILQEIQDIEFLEYRQSGN